MSNFGEAERKIAQLLHQGQTFILNGEKFTVQFDGKPVCDKGEPKTDVYVFAKSSNNRCITLKISFKKENADFIENKINSDRAKALFGSNWSSIIQKATASIKDRFENKKLIYKVKGNRTEAGAITLGWKFELLNKTGGDLSGLMDLDKSQVIDVYSGIHLPLNKKNASVNGKIIENSGIANYILMSDSVNTAQDVIDNLQTIENYVDKHPNVYFACKALNYRTFHNKYDGDRPLSVYVDWAVVNGKLQPKLIYDNPLNVKGTSVANKLKESLQLLNINNTDDIKESMVDNPNVILK